MSTTIFVALQCCQCSTMQVKQRKKSSNKWTCVVCNQKQSVLKVFAQGPMAKDLRKFVQSFNMSRKTADENQPFDPPSEYDIKFEDDGGSGDPENQRKRRNNWTEYLNPEDHGDNKAVLQEEEQGDDLELKIVTELQPKFKRPKLRNYQSGEDGDHQLYKPVFKKRDGKASASQCSNIVIEIMGEMRDCKSSTAKGNSKWKDYITQDEDDDDGDFGVSGRRRNFQSHFNKCGDAVLETESEYQTVEDDVHPDFM